MLVGMRGRMHQFVVRALSAARGREVFAFDARYFESGCTIAFFNDLVDAGRFDNAAGLMDFGHFDSPLETDVDFQQVPCRPTRLEHPSANRYSSFVKMRPGGRNGTATAGYEPTRCDGQDSQFGICCEEFVER